MNRILIVDASSSDNRVMSSLLTKAGYDPLGSQKKLINLMETSENYRFSEVLLYALYLQLQDDIELSGVHDGYI